MIYIMYRLLVILYLFDPLLVRRGNLGPNHVDSGFSIRRISPLELSAEHLCVRANVGQNCKIKLFGKKNYLVEYTGTIHIFLCPQVLLIS